MQKTELFAWYPPEIAGKAPYDKLEHVAIPLTKSNVEEYAKNGEKLLPKNKNFVYFRTAAYLRAGRLKFELPAIN